MFNENFEIVNKWLGWGDPFKGIWFVGVEEGEAWETEDQIKEISNKQFTYRKEKNVKFPIATVSAKIAVMCSRNYGNFDNWRVYRDEVLWFKGSGIFNANLLPLGEGLEKWNKNYKSLFGLDRSQIEDYRKKVENERYPLLRQFKKETEPQAVICYGKGMWKDFKIAFNLTEGNQSKIYKEFSTLIYESKRIILTRHFANGFPDKIAEFIGQVIIKWGCSVK